MTLSSQRTPLDRRALNSAVVDRFGHVGDNPTSPWAGDKEIGTTLRTPAQSIAAGRLAERILNTPRAHLPVLPDAEARLLAEALLRAESVLNACLRTDRTASYAEGMPSPDLIYPEPGHRFLTPAELVTAYFTGVVTHD